MRSAQAPDVNHQLSLAREKDPNFFGDGGSQYHGIFVSFALFLFHSSTFDASCSENNKNCRPLRKQPRSRRKTPGVNNTASLSSESQPGLNL